MPAKALPMLTFLLVLGLGPVSLKAQEATRPTPQAKRPPMNPMLRAPKRVRPAHRVDLNTASQAELMKLPGITAELAAQIIAGRPYKSKIELMTRNILGYDRYDPIRHLIVAAPPR